MALRNASVARRAGLGAAALAASVLIGASSPALAADDGYQNVFSSVLGAVGLMPADKAPEIDYRERPPLVVPPKTALVKPEEAGARRPSAWPQDPDVLRRRREAEESKSPMHAFDKSRDWLMSRDEQMKYRAVAPARALAPSGCEYGEHSDTNCRVGPDEMKAEEARWKAANPNKSDEETIAGVEPSREYLTEPPKGYRKPTKTVAATHEAPEVHKDTSSPLSTYIQPAGQKNIDPLNDN